VASYLLSGVLLWADEPLCGLRPASPLELAYLRPDAPRLRFEARPADSLPPPAEWLHTRSFPDDDQPWLSVGRVPTGYFMRVHGEADFLYDANAATILGAGVPGCSAEARDQLLVDQAMPQVLHAMGRFAIHASSVEWRPGVVVGFAGNSGAGKSTLAASLSRTRPLIGDDCLAVTFEDGRPLAHASYAALRLCSDSTQALFGDPAAFPSASPRTDKLRVEVGGSPGGILRALYLLENGPGEVKVQPLHRRDAVTRLASYVYRLDPDDRVRLAGELDFLERLVRAVDVARLVLPHRFDSIAAVPDLISRHLAA
jgi:hypothetical protein